MFLQKSSVAEVRKQQRQRSVDEEERWKLNIKPGKKETYIKWCFSTFFVNDWWILWYQYAVLVCVNVNIWIWKRVSVRFQSIFSRRFRRKSRILQWLVFFSSVQRVTSTFLFICSTSYLAEVNPDFTLNILFQSSHGSKFGLNVFKVRMFGYNVFKVRMFGYNVFKVTTYFFFGIETQFFGHWDFFANFFFTKGAPPIFLTIFDRMDKKSKSVPSGAPIRFNFWVFFGCRRREYFDTFKSFCCFWTLDMADLGCSRLVSVTLTGVLPSR